MIIPTDRIIYLEKSKIETLHLEKKGKKNYYYRDQFNNYYQTEPDGRISKIAGDYLSNIQELIPEGTVNQYYRGDKTWADFPSSLPPSGPAGGDLQGTYPNPELILVGVTPGTYGNGTNVAQVTVDAKGRVLNVVNVPIIGGGGGTSPDVTIDGGTIIAPTENVLIDGGAI